MGTSEVRGLLELGPEGSQLGKGRSQRDFGDGSCQGILVMERWGGVFGHECG